MVDSSFYADGETYDTAVVESNDHAASTTPSQAPSSFYPDGNLYDYLSAESEVVALIQALAASTASNASSASTSASNAASSASSAASAATAAAAAAVASAAGTATPVVNGTAAVGVSTKWAHEDHVHPTDTSRASVTAVALKADKTYVDTQDAAGKTYTDTSVSPKADKTYVDTQDALKAPLAGPAFTGNGTITGQFTALGASGALGWADRVSGNSWQWYAAGGTAYLFRSANRISIDEATGDFSLLTGRLFVGGSSTPRVREVLISARTYYVRTDGNDSNAGLINSSGGAFLTIQKAIDTVAALDMGVFQVTIQVGAGTYTGSMNLRPYVGLLAPIIVGNEVSPSTVVIASTTAAVAGDGTPPWHVRGMSLSPTAGFVTIDVANNGSLYFQNIIFGALGGGAYHIRSWKSSVVTATGNYTIAGGADGHYLAAYGGVIVALSLTVTVTGTPAFAAAFATASIGGILYTSGATFTGAATGIRYSASMNGVIQTSTGLSTYFPGNSTVAPNTGGQYG